MIRLLDAQWEWNKMTRLQNTREEKGEKKPRKKKEPWMERFEPERETEMDHGGGRRRKIRILDVGCGTGAIGIALANLFPHDVQVCAIDVTRAAVDLSNENARSILFGRKCSTDDNGEMESDGDGMDDGGGTDGSHQYQSILCSAADYTNGGKNEMTTMKEKDNDMEDGRFMFEYDIIVSNPPYIPSNDMKTLTSDVVDFEDYGALCGGGDGLDVIRDILRRLPEWCEKQETRMGMDDGAVDDDDDNDDSTMLHAQPLFRPICWMEVDTSHPTLIEKVVEGSFKDDIDFLEGLKDFGGLDRFVKLEIKAT